MNEPTATTLTTSTTTLAIGTAKGRLVGTPEECARWLAELCPAYPAIERVGDRDVDLDIDIDLDNIDDEEVEAAYLAAIERALAEADEADEDDETVLETETIEALREEAAVAGDLAQVAVCDLALDGNADARAECARVVAEYAAQSAPLDHPWQDILDEANAADDAAMAPWRALRDARDRYGWQSDEAVVASAGPAA